MIRFCLGTFIALLTLSCQHTTKELNDNKDYLFRSLPAESTGIEFANSLVEDPEHSIINYIYFYNGGGVAAGDINNDGLPDLFFVSNMGDNKLYLNKGNFTFEDISKTANIAGNADWNTGATMVDINDDGLLDIYVSAVSGLLDFKGHNELYINNGDGTFTENAAKYGLDFRGFSTQAYFFDYDKDEDLDVYIVNHAVHTALSHGPANVRNNRKPFVGDVLLANHNGEFTDVSEKAGIYGGMNGYGLSASLADFNNDGWVDIYVCNDFHEDDYYYLNNRDGSFKEALRNSFSTISRFSMGSDAADINGDGYQDLITLDMLPKDERVIKESEGDGAMYNMQKRLNKLGYKDQYARNMLQLNQNGDYFVETAIFNEIEATDWSWSPLIADFNNDGHQDLYITNGILRRPNDLDFKNFVATAFRNRSKNEGLKWLYKSKDAMPSGIVPNEIFMGNSSKFTNKTGDWIEGKPSLSNGSIYVDLDLDGDLDLVTNNLNSPASVFSNTINDQNNYLSLKFKYLPGNSEGIGTKAIVYSNKREQHKQMFKSRGFLSSIEGTLHFGLKNDQKVDSVKIIWPNGQFQTVNAPDINQRLNIVYSDQSKAFSYSSPEPGKRFEKTAVLDYIHREDTYDDFYNEKLIPYKVSEEGPAMAIGDVDNNGFKDLYLGGASGFPAKLFLNTGTKLVESKIPQFLTDKAFEDNTAVFFDADGDGDPDLYVGSGINSARIKAFEKNRLYINDHGNFSRKDGSIPGDESITKMVIAKDLDLDGDIDLFVGNHSMPGDFGKPANSYLLLNDGEGNFKKDENFKFNSHVTSAKWEDINDDNYPDLLITAEWDHPYIFTNKRGKLEPLSIPGNLTGLWQEIEYFDIDNDGDNDIILGNWGLNTRFNPQPEEPLTMYYGDFNLDGKYEAILAYNKDGNNYPVNSKHELVSQLNFISKKYNTHKEFALQTMEDIFSEEIIEKSRKYVVNTTASGYLENENGQFLKFQELPSEFQTAPINSIDKVEVDESQRLLITGNSLKVNTYHGGYTSMKGLLVKNLSDYQNASNFGISPIHKQIKKTETLNMKNKKLLIILPNNEAIQTYTFL